MMDRTIEEMMLEMQEDEENIQAHPCCANCTHCFTEYGMTHCYYEGNNLTWEVLTDEEEWNPDTDRCTLWKSDISGMPTRERQRLLEEGEREQARRSFYED